MYDTGRVLFGIIIFIAIFTSPFWINLAGGQSGITPILKLPDGVDKCIHDTEYMKNYHMNLLDDWRDLVVRENKRFYYVDGDLIYINGVPMEMSLTKSCMTCHNNKAEFCDQCHNYLDVNPYCWDCHVYYEQDKVIIPQKTEQKETQKLDEDSVDIPVEVDNE